MSVPILSSSSQLNIQGVNASNISSTPIISTYPTSTTSNSIGHYNFVNQDTKASNHLNVSASSSGGHIFSHASSTQAPKEILKLDRDVMTVNTSLLRNPNAKTALNFDVNELALNNNNNLYNSNLSSKEVLFNDIPNNLTGRINAELMNLVSPTTGNITNCYAGQVQIRDNNDKNILATTITRMSNIAETIKSDLTKTDLSFTDISNNVSVLSSTDLTFNNVSIFSSFNDNAKKHIVPQIIVSSLAIYADSSIAPQPSPFLSTFGFGGWAYSKRSPQATNAKINWYFPFPIIGGTVGDLKGLYYQIFNNCLGVGDLPFFTVYTRPVGDGTDYASWYHSSMTYVPNSNSSPNQTCQMFMNIKNLSFTPNSIGIQNQINMIQSTVNNPRGTYLDSDIILFISCGTNSSSALNAVDFSCSKIGMVTDNFSAEFLLL